VEPEFDVQAPPDIDQKETERGEGSDEKAEKKSSWMNAVTAAAQLTLDVIRVIREAVDLYRKLFPGKSA
jgi:hypothetical protein